jgi:two-component system sensor kinase FixL
LHDGVCQQLAAIAYLLDILADRLQEKNQPEFAEAERVGHLIKEVNTQARNVAHGLFPARLEEHGLIMALEELAANASNRYRVSCQFSCQIALVKFDSEMELHLYYIVQEALLNAVNHGKATNVIVTLAVDGDRFRLAVQDNGTGFEPSNKGRGGLGIGIMKYRAKVIEATLDLKSQPNQGTRIEIVFNPPRGKM